MSFSIKKHLTLHHWLGIAIVLLILFPLATHAGFFADATKEVAGGMLWLADQFFFLGISLFLKVVEVTILNFATYWEQTSLGSDLKVIWQIVRDVVNLLIVLLFIITAMLTAFGNNFVFKRKLLLGLLAAALFVNFSAFITLFIIDVSHALFIGVLGFLDIQAFSSISPFGGYGSVFLQISGNGPWNLLYGLVMSTTSFFLFFGFLWLSIILIERFIITLFLVISSPIAVLGFFTNLAGDSSEKSPGKFLSNIYIKWKTNLVYVFVTPIVLIFGLVLILALFFAVQSQVAKPDELIKLQGPAAFGILLQLSIVSLILILGVFKVGGMVKNIKFGGGHIYSASTLNRGKLLLGAFRNATGVLRGRGGGGTNWAQRTVRNTQNVVKGVGEVGRDVWGGKRSAFKEFSTLKENLKKDRATTGVRKATRAAVRSNDPEELMRVARGGKLTPEEFTTLMKRKDEGLKETLAGNPNISKQEIAHLLKESDDSEKVLKAVINNPQTPTAILEELSKNSEKDAEIRMAAADVLQDRTGEKSKRFTDQDRENLARDRATAGVRRVTSAAVRSGNPEELKRVARNAKLTPEEFDTLMKRDDGGLREALAGNPNISEQEIARLTKEFRNSDTILKAVINNPKTSTTILEDLGRDGNTNAEIRMAAADSLQKRAEKKSKKKKPDDYDDYDE